MPSSTVLVAPATPGVRLRAHRGPSRRAVRRLASALLLVGLLGIGLPAAPAGAASPYLHLEPGSGPGGSTVTVRGYNLPPRSYVQILWNGQFKGYPTAYVHRYGRFRATITAPRGTPGAPHRISVASARTSRVTSFSQLGPVRASISYSMTRSSTATPIAPPPPTPGASVRVTSVGALKDALANNSITDIVVANGTYRVSPASAQASNSLWIGSRYASRTRPVVVRAETRGGVTIDGGGATYFGGLTFAEGAHHQTWDGFNFANGEPTQTGVIVFGGYPGRAAPHHIVLRHMKFLGSLRSSTNGDHSIYFSQAVGGPHDIVVEDISVDGRAGRSDGLDSAIHFYHGDSVNRNAYNVTVRRLTVSGTNRAVVLWNDTLRNIVVEGAKINAADIAVRYEGGSGITLRDITTTNSLEAGFYSSLGSNPPGVTFVRTTFR